MHTLMLEGHCCHMFEVYLDAQRPQGLKSRLEFAGLSPLPRRLSVARGRGAVAAVRVDNDLE